MSQPDKMHPENRKPDSSLAARSLRRLRRLPFLRASVLALLCLAVVAQLRADTISGTVKDPSGLVVAGARVEITGGNLTQPLVLASDNSGKFAAPNLIAGQYSVRVVKDGFDDLITPVNLRGTADLALSLTLAAQQTRVTVTATSTGFTNSDAVYRQLRDVGLGDTYRVDNYTMNLDVGSFEFKSGTITLLALVNNCETGAIFVGQGHFTLRPPGGLDTREMVRRSGGSPTAEEDFTEVVFRFTNSLYPQVAKALGAKTDTPGQAASAFQDWKNNVRHRHEVPEGFTQAILENETIDNVDADVLASVYNPKHPPFFNAYMRGTPHKDLRFFVRVRVGAIPQLDSPEEVALINCNGGGMDDGVWYSQHLASELNAHTANSREDRRLFATHRYDDRNRHREERSPIQPRHDRV